MKRSEVFALIDKERQIQESRFGELYEYNTAAHYVIYIEEYLNQAKKRFFNDHITGGVPMSKFFNKNGEPLPIEDQVEVTQRYVLDKLINVAALAVAAMENLYENEEEQTNE